MKSTNPLLSMPVLTHMHPGNPHGLRFADGDTGDKGGGSGGEGDGSGPDTGDKSGEGDGNKGSGTGGGDNTGDQGFPKDTPVADMTTEQQAAYWKHQARKHESRATARADYDQVKAERDRLKEQHQTAEEKAIEDAKNAARAEERATWAPRLVKSELRSALRARGLKNEQVAALVGPLDHTHFLTDSGEVDADKVSNYAAGFGQSGQQWPDTGQGRRGSHAAEKSVGAGRDLFRDRHKKK